MKIIRDVQDWRRLRCEMTGQSIGFVPTMGALHEGHASLIRRAVDECDSNILSIYINETQFNNPDDLARYPQTIERDLEMAEAEGVDTVILPNFRQMYPDQYKFRVCETQFSNQLCGAHRPGHFDGVLTVVMKLFQLIKPTRAYFGEKDFQQLELIKGMVEALFLGVEIVPCPIVRESDGLAMSSRNLRLSASARQKAPLIAELLHSNRSNLEIRNRLREAGFEVDYVETIGDRRFVAATLEGVRLIDNAKNPL